MASTAELEALRRATDTYPTDDTYSDSLLGALFDSLGLNKAAATVWREKAGSYAKLVSTSEAGSSRSMSDLYTHAKEMAEMYSSLAEQEPTTTYGGLSFTIPIERP